MIRTNTDWQKPDDFAPPTDGAALIISILTVLIPTFIFAGSQVGNINKLNAEHVASGQAVIFTAFGAFMVALGLILRQGEPAKEADVRHRERKLKDALDQRPDLIVGPLAQDTVTREAARKDHQEREDLCARDVVTSKKKVARWRSIASGVELGGAVTLLVGTIYAFCAWHAN